MNRGFGENIPKSFVLWAAGCLACAQLPAASPDREVFRAGAAASNITPFLGGEVGMWTSGDEGKTSNKRNHLTTGNQHNHRYMRQPVNALPDFYALWADGHGHEKLAPCRLYFCTEAGDVRVLPLTMSAPFERPMTLNQQSEKSP